MLRIDKVSKKYITGDLVQVALNEVALNLRDNEFVAILGPSGSGKTTLLNVIGGLDRYDSGDLIINGISTKEYKDRDWDSYRNHTIGFVFQSYNLIPHQTLLSNVELALTISGISKTERRKKAMEALNQVGLGEQYHKRPSQLSGGQMQRVAIARALVNDPDILLADEPTGALDSDTSVQVMNLLKEVAKNRLVVMVTHNPDLAEAYATRIVNLRDGSICSDTDPFWPDEKSLGSPTHENMGQTSMSWLTSLSLSFNNLKTKKGRTILTAFAGSIGIIGIALILSLSNGVNTYIKTIEEDTLSEYPLSIESSGFDISSMLVPGDVDKETSSEDIHVSETLTNIFSKIGSNDLKSLKSYLDKNHSKIDPYANSVEYTYNVEPQLFSSDVDNIRQVNPDKSFAALGMGSTGSSNRMMSSAMSTNVFYPLPEKNSLYSDQYDIKAGTWPKSDDEVVVVLTSKGNISDMMLYTLGLRAPSELDQMIQQFSREEEVVIPNNKKGYNYNDILGTTFKLVNATEFYQYNSEYQIWSDKTDDKDYMKEIVQNGKDIKIVGIVQPKKSSNARMLSSGIYYPASLAKKLAQDAADSEIVKQQLQNKDINVFTGKAFDAEDTENSFDMKKLLSIDGDAVQSAFKVDSGKMKLDLSNLNNVMSQASMPQLDLNSIAGQLNFSLSPDQTQKLVNDLMNGYQLWADQHPEVDFGGSMEQLMEYLQSPEVSQLIAEEIKKCIEENGEITITQEQMQAIMSKIIEDYTKEHELLDPSKFTQVFMEYLRSEGAKAIIANGVSEMIVSNGLEQQISSIMEQYMQSAMTSVSAALQQELTASMNTFASSMAQAVSFDEQAFAEAVQFNMDEKDLAEVMTSMMNRERTTYDSNLIKIGYADLDKPAAINIYPIDFVSKEQIIKVLDNYNAKMEEVKQEDKVITYTDLVGTLMSSVTDIINVISYVLIAFVAISLVVSSIMIGIITYISVLERKKEIGILRAIGASKRNVSEVFNAETLIIGLFSGLIGIGITLLLLIPGNQLIHSIAKSTQVSATLPFAGGIILIVLSTVLTLIGGFIPSKKAAKEDPVAALRSE